MPFFQYSATDQAGKRVSGTLQAATADAARDALRLAGLTTLDVRAPGPTPTAMATRPVQQPRVAAAPVQQRMAPVPVARPIERPAVPVINMPTAPAAKDRVKTRMGRDKDLYFLLTQLASFYKSGISPSQALQHLAAKAPKLYQPSLLYAASRVGEGGRLSDSLELYPALYPAHVVGALRAAETAGFVPAAMERLALTAHSAHRINARMSYFSWIAGIMICITPVSLSVIQGALKSMELQDKNGGNLPVYGTITDAVRAQLLSHLPVILLTPALLLLFAYAWKSYPMSRLRHTIGLVPPLNSRAKMEGLLWTMYSLAMSTRAGLPHQSAYQMAVGSIPNMLLRDQAVGEAAVLREGEPLSVALSRSKYIPSEYADIAHNGELAGNLPGALEDITRSAESQFDAYDQRASALLLVLLYIPLGILTLILAVYLAGTWYSSMIDFGLKDT